MHLSIYQSIGRSVGPSPSVRRSVGVRPSFGPSEHAIVFCRSDDLAVYWSVGLSASEQSGKLSVGRSVHFVDRSNRFIGQAVLVVGPSLHRPVIGPSGLRSSWWSGGRAVGRSGGGGSVGGVGRVVAVRGAGGRSVGRLHWGIINFLLFGWP